MKRDRPIAAPAPARATDRTIRDRLHARTRELAHLSGRSGLQVSQADYEQARRELTGESDSDRQEAVLDLIPPAPTVGAVTASRASISLGDRNPRRTATDCFVLEVPAT